MAENEHCMLIRPSFLRNALMLHSLYDCTREPREVGGSGRKVVIVVTTLAEVAAIEVVEDRSKCSCTTCCSCCNYNGGSYCNITTTV